VKSIIYSPFCINQLETYKPKTKETKVKLTNNADQKNFAALSSHSSTSCLLVKSIAYRSFSINKIAAHKPQRINPKA